MIRTNHYDVPILHLFPQPLNTCAIMDRRLALDPRSLLGQIVGGQASREQAAHLGVAPGSVLLLTKGLVYDHSGRPVELSQLYYRGDRFRLFLDSFRLGGSGNGKIVLGE